MSFSTLFSDSGRFRKNKIRNWTLGSVWLLTRTQRDLVQTHKQPGHGSFQLQSVLILIDRRHAHATAGMPNTTNVLH